MREGVNPNKNKRKLEVYYMHRVISAVYVPNLNGFYANAIEVLDIFFNSLLSTIDEKTAVTIIDNACCDEITGLIESYSDKIDTIIRHKTNIGKIDAQIGAARGAHEPFITLTDSDILFKRGWVESVLSMFTNFPEVGSVSPIPVRKSMFYYTSSVLKNIITQKLDFTLEKIPDNMPDYNKYLSSINWDRDEIDEWPVVKYNGHKAIIGSGHQVLTINRNILFSSVPSLPSLVLVGNKSEENYIDRSIDMSNKLRLATYENWAYHIGNRVESWMQILINESNYKQVNFKKVAINPVELKEFNVSKKKLKYYAFRKKLIKFLFKIKYSNLDLNS